MSIFKQIPKSEWPEQPDHLVRVYKSTDFLVQEYAEPSGVTRLTINSTKRKNGMWVDGITWDQLMHVKRMIGYSNVCAVEIYPPDRDVVNVANIRHLWLVDMPDFAWQKDGDV